MIHQISKWHEKALVLGNNLENANQVPDRHHFYLILHT